LPTSCPVLLGVVVICVGVKGVLSFSRLREEEEEKHHLKNIFVIG